MVKVLIKKLDPNVKLPIYKTEGSSGMDLAANNKKKITILFSPCSASFDSFKNFEERGKHFNFLLKKYNKLF